MPEFPRGTVTLLFTDIEGSTRLLDELPNAFPNALAEHRRALREVFARHGGVEVDTQGDAFFVAFAGASEAVAAAEDGQRALANGPVRVRMGLRTGEPTATADAGEQCATYQAMVVTTEVLGVELGTYESGGGCHNPSEQSS